MDGLSQRDYKATTLVVQTIIFQSGKVVSIGAVKCIGNTKPQVPGIFADGRCFVSAMQVNEGIRGGWAFKYCCIVLCRHPLKFRLGKPLWFLLVGDGLPAQGTAAPKSRDEGKKALVL